MRVKYHGMVLGMCFSFLVSQVPVEAADYYVDNVAGDDSNPGSRESPWRSLACIHSRTIFPGDSVLLRRGQIWNEGLSIHSSGVDGNPVIIGAYSTGDSPVVRNLAISGDFTTVEELTVDADKAAIDAVQIRGVQGTTLRRLTVRNGVKDGVDVSGARNLLIETCHIHHFLAGSFNSQADAHGIVVKGSQGITVRNTEIHHVSGDCIQADPNRDAQNLTKDILIEGCHFWTGPLTEDFNSGWVRTDNLAEEQRQYPGENAVDTKVVKEGWQNISRMRISIRNVVAHGWKPDGFIANKAAFNLKEKIEAVLDGVTVYDSEIAFRLRGNSGNANVTIKNAVVHDCKTAIRTEDQLANLRIYNSTFGDSIGTQLKVVGGRPSTWDFRNNALVGRKPDLFAGETNIIVPEESQGTNFMIPGSGDYHLRPGSSLIEAGEALADVSVDRDGKNRTAPYDVGAYEFSIGGVPAIPSKRSSNQRGVGDVR